MVAHADAIAASDLARGHQIRKRLNEQALDGALQMTCSIPGIGALRQQKLPGALSDADLKDLSAAAVWMRSCSISRSVSMILRSSSWPRGLKNHDLVQTVNKLRGELSTGRRYAGA